MLGSKWLIIGLAVASGCEDDVLTGRSQSDTTLTDASSPSLVSDGSSERTEPDANADASGGDVVEVLSDASSLNVDANSILADAGGQWMDASRQDSRSVNDAAPMRRDIGGGDNEAFCGDGRVREDRLVDDPDFEECDDGNQRPNDGCDPNCRFEGLPPLSCVNVQGRDRRTTFCRGRRSYRHAQRACRLQQDFTGTLATVVSSPDNDLIANVLRRNQEGRGWIGLNDTAREGDLVWDGRSTRYSRFGGRGDRNSPAADCTFLRLDNENWQMGACDDPSPFVCEQHPL